MSLGVWGQPGQQSKISLLSYLLASEPVPGAASAAFLPSLGLLIACYQGKGLSLSPPTWVAPMPELGWGRRKAREEENTNPIRLGPIGEWLKTAVKTKLDSGSWSANHHTGTTPRRWPASVSTHLLQQELHQVLRRVNFMCQLLILLGCCRAISSEEEASLKQKTLLYVGQTLSSCKRLKPT